jgi:hypothetical protein
MTDRERDHQTQADIERILGELTQRAYNGELRGIAVATITEAGFGCQIAHTQRHKGPLLAAAVLLQHHIVASFQPREPPPIDGDGAPT